jgi:hypothetical protein
MGMALMRALWNRWVHTHRSPSGAAPLRRTTAGNFGAIQDKVQEVVMSDWHPCERLRFSPGNNRRHNIRIGG